MERWLLISNCQTAGLANAFQMVNSRFDVTPMDVYAFKRNQQEVVSRFGEYFRVLMLNGIERDFDFDISLAPNLVRLPHFSFYAYHPDCVYASNERGFSKGVLDDYHSLLIVAAFNAGLNQSDAAALFNGSMYERCGYLDYWVPQRDRLIADFAACGFDLSREVRRWGRHDSFMHTFNHPKMRCLYDVARVVMASMGVPDERADVMPADNLTVGVSWPVYPEIAEHLGIAGSMRFKRFNAYHHLGLAQFIAESYALYEKEGAVQPNPVFQSAYDRVMEAL